MNAGGFGGGAASACDLFAVMTEEKEPGRAAANHDEHADCGDDQLELAFERSSPGFRRAAFCLFGFSHRPPIRFRREFDVAGQALRRDTMPPAHPRSLDGDAKVIMVNGTFRLPGN